MSKSIIIFGAINKKLLLPFFLAATEIIYLVFNKYYPVHAENLILQIYGLSLAEMSIKFLPCILKITDKEELKQKEETIKKKDVFIIFIIHLILCPLTKYILF